MPIIEWWTCDTGNRWSGAGGKHIHEKEQICSTVSLIFLILYLQNSEQWRVQRLSSSCLNLAPLLNRKDSIFPACKGLWIRTTPDSFWFRITFAETNSEELFIKYRLSSRRKVVPKVPTVLLMQYGTVIGNVPVMKTWNYFDDLIRIRIQHVQRTRIHIRIPRLRMTHSCKNM